MPRGGLRKGSGRPKGSKGIVQRHLVDSNTTLVTRRIANREAVSGRGLPLEVMLRNMRWADQTGAAVLEKVVAAASAGEAKQSLDLYRELQRLRDMAQKYAKDAAPYMHAPVSAMALEPEQNAEQQGGGSVLIGLDPDRLAHLRERYLKGMRVIDGGKDST